MKLIFSKAAAAAVLASFFALSVQAGTIHITADTAKMSKMDHKMSKKKMGKMKKGKMGKDTSGKM
jgi:hypothetical protein